MEWNLCKRHEETCADPQQMLRRCGGRRDPSSTTHSRTERIDRSVSLSMSAPPPLPSSSRRPRARSRQTEPFSAAAQKSREKQAASNPGSPRVKSGETRTKPEATAVVHVRRRRPGAVRGRAARDQPRDL